MTRWATPRGTWCHGNEKTPLEPLPTSLRRTWEKACRTVGIAGISVYEGCKHSFATDAIARDVPERQLQAFLGHADVRSTRRYARMASSALIHVLRPRRPTRPGKTLSRACPTDNEASFRPPESKGKLVEAAGIEPAADEPNPSEDKNSGE